MTSFSAIVVNDKGQRITVESGTFAELRQTVERLGEYGYKHLGDDHFNSRGVQSKGQGRQTPNVPPNVKPCPHHPHVGMGHDKNNPGEYYCRGKEGGKWCGYKASKDGVIRNSILDTQPIDEDDLAQSQIDF